MNYSDILSQPATLKESHRTDFALENFSCKFWQMGQLENQYTNFKMKRVRCRLLIYICTSCCLSFWLSAKFFAHVVYLKGFSVVWVRM